MNIGQAMRYSDELQQMQPNELEQAYVELRGINAELLEALEMGLEIGDQCSRGFLAKFQQKARAAIAKAKA